MKHAGRGAVKHDLAIIIHMVCVYPLLHAISEKLAIHASFFLIKKNKKKHKNDRDRWKNMKILNYY